MLLATPLSTAAGLRLIADRVLDALAPDIEVNGTSVALRASLGGVVVADAAADPDDVLERAVEAMYTAKQTGRSCVESYSKPA